MSAALETSEKKNDFPILIVDQEGIIGEGLINELKKESLIVFVSRKKIEEENVVHVPYLKKIPIIPDNTYSHIFIIDETTVISSQFITPFIKKAQHDNSSLILVLNKELTDPEFIFKYISSYDSARVVITGDIFTENTIYNPNTFINKFIETARGRKYIEVPGDGMAQAQPIFFEDIVLGILQVGFIEKNDNKIFFLYPKEKFSLLSIAHMFQKIEPDIKIDFAKNYNVSSGKDLPIDGVFVLEDNYDLSSRIKKINLEKKDEETVIKKNPKNSRVKFSPILIGMVLTILFFFLLPLISTLLSAGTGAFYLNNLKNNISSQDISSARNSASLSYNFFNFSKTSFSLLEKEALFLGLGNMISPLSTKINQGQEISFAAENIMESGEKIKNVFAGNTKNSKSDFQSALDSLKTALISYHREVDSGNIPEDINKKIDSLISFSSSTIDLWPDILGFNGKKTYLILFENNMELRPGGGFIGSYAIMTLDKGKTTGFKIYDVYDADGQLKNHVEPPFAIRRYLPSVNWYLRDSNWDVDFSKNAVSSAVFLNSEMHQGVDGVVAVDLVFVKNLINQIGPVKVSDYNTIITSDNLFQTVESKVQDNFFPGSIQKRNFLSSLFNAINLKMSAQKDKSYILLMQAFVKSLFEKHVIFAFNNLSLQTVFSVNGWGSTLFDNRIKDSKTINDFLGINEANLGANKVNYYISRSVSQEVSFDKDGTINEKLNINIKNNADKKMGSKGLYKVYLRIILPQGAKLNGVEINSTAQRIIDAVTDPALYESKNFISPTGLEIERYDESGKTIFGFLVLVNPEQLKVISVRYALLQKINLKNPQVAYSQKIFKQPGIENYPYAFSMELPQGFAQNDPQKLKFKNGLIYLSTNIIKDDSFVINLAKQ